MTQQYWTAESYLRSLGLPEHTEVVGIIHDLRTEAPYLDAPLVGKPDFEQRIGDTQVRYCRIFRLLMRHFWPRARMEFVRSDPNRACGLAGHRRFTGFSHPRLVDRLPLPYPSSRRHTPVGTFPDHSAFGCSSRQAPMISSLCSTGFRDWPKPVRSTDLTRNATLQPQRPSSTPRALQFSAFTDTAQMMRAVLLARATAATFIGF